MLDTIIIQMKEYILVKIKNVYNVKKVSINQTQEKQVVYLVQVA